MKIREKEVLTSEKAPQAIGPYSQAIKAGELIFASGQIGIVRETGELISDKVDDQTRQVLSNLRWVLESGGSSLSHIVKTTVYLRDINDFACMNAVYGEFFNEQPPARATVQVAALPKDAAVEIEAIAVQIHLKSDASSDTV